MTHMFSLKSGFLAVSLGIAAGLAVFTPSQQAQAGGSGPVSCDTDTAKPYAEYVALCKKAKGDKGSIKKVMKVAQKAMGGDVKCTTCHDKGSGEGFKPDGVKEHWDKFKVHLAKATAEFTP
jgi:hypothetical protein